MCRHSRDRGPRERREREKGAENTSEGITAENFLTWKRKQTSKSRRGREFCTGLTQKGTHTKTLKIDKNK